MKEGGGAFPARGIASSKKLCDKSVSPHLLLLFASCLILLSLITSWGQDGYHSSGHCVHIQVRKEEKGVR